MGWVSVTAGMSTLNTGNPVGVVQEFRTSAILNISPQNIVKGFNECWRPFGCESNRIRLNAAVNLERMDDCHDWTVRAGFSRLFSKVLDGFPRTA